MRSRPRGLGTADWIVANPDAMQLRAAVLSDFDWDLASWRSSRKVSLWIRGCDLNSLGMCVRTRATRRRAGTFERRSA
jgi:hypothetical protein